MWTIELWHASGRNTGSTGENPVGEGKGAFSCACNTLVPSRPRSFPFQPLPPIPRSRFLFRSGRGVERERKRERKKERKNRLIRNTMIIYKKVHSMNTPNGTHCVIAHNFSRKGKQNYYRRTADCYRQIEFPPRSKFNRRIKRFVVHDSSTSSD